MKKLSTLFLSAFAVVIICSSFAPKSKSDDKIKGIESVYLFGFSFSFADSTIYFTDIQHIDSAQTGSHGMLMKRPVFSEQMRSHLMQNGVATPTCAVFYFNSLEKADKQMIKIMKHYEKKNLYWKILTKDEFNFINILD